MGKIFSIDSATKAIIQDVLDDLLVNTSAGGLGKTCLLVYPPRLVKCANCVLDPNTNRSAGRYRSGGPMPFNDGRCPLCSGAGAKSQEVSEEITFKCNWEPRSFQTKLPNLQVPDGAVEIKGYVKDLPKVLKADYIVVNTPLAPYVRQKFRLFGEPGDPSNLVQGRYFTAVLSRWNG